MVSKKQRELLKKRQKKKKRKRYLKKEEPKGPKRPKGRFHDIYHDKYKQLFIITIVMLAISLAIIGYTYVQTGDVIYKGVSLSGGLTLTVVTSDSPLDVQQVEQDLLQEFPEVDLIVREINELGEQKAIAVEAATQSNSPESLDDLEGEMKGFFAQRLDGIEDRVSAEIVGPSLGQSFFRQTARAILIAFAFMGLVVFLYFGETNSQKATVAALTLVEAVAIWYSSNILMLFLAIIVGGGLIYSFVKYSIPSAAVILAAISTIITTIAVVDLMQMRISTAGIAGFLMLIGYSVDTDILLSTRVLKRRGGTVYQRVLGTIKTGLTMELTTATASLVAVIFTQSEVIREIMLIIFIGLMADIFYTWIQNVGIIRLYKERDGA